MLKHTEAFSSFSFSLFSFSSLSLALLLTVVSALSGCGSSEVVAPNVSQRWLADGSLMISRPVPPVSSPEQLTALGFLPRILPSTQLPKGTWLLIKTGDRTLNLMDGERAVISAPAEGAQLLHSGRFQVVHKQRNPLWYAPAAYFEQRKLPVPPEGDKARYRRGALGDFVLYIDSTTPIHSGPVWTSDVGGIKLDEDSISRIYYILQVGAAVQVK